LLGNKPPVAGRSSCFTASLCACVATHWPPHVTVVGGLQKLLFDSSTTAGRSHAGRPVTCRVRCASHFRGGPPCIGSMILQGACHFVTATLRIASAKDSVTAGQRSSLSPPPGTDVSAMASKEDWLQGVPQFRGAWQNAIRGLGEAVRELTRRNPRSHVETSMLASICPCPESPETTRSL